MAVMVTHIDCERDRQKSMKEESARHIDEARGRRKENTEKTEKEGKERTSIE